MQYLRLKTLFYCYLFVSTAFAQLTENENNFSKQSSIPQSKLLEQQTQLPDKMVIQDGPVDPREYVVGPGDIFSVSIWAAMPLIFQVPVTPEGSVVIPTVNEVNIAGMTLDSARKIVLNEIKKKYITGNASFTLYVPRRFTVTISGVVLNAGKYIVQSTQRVDAALELANDRFAYKQKRVTQDFENTEFEIKKMLNLVSHRHIKIVRKNGSTVNADIEKYYAKQNSTYNPLLQDGDVIIIPPTNVGKEFIGVHGAVAKDGVYEFVDGDSLTTLLAIGGGLTSYSDSQHVVIARNSSNGAQIQFEIDARKILTKQAPDIILQSGDRIIVARKNSIDRGGVISIEGEVVRPGSYPIVQDSTTLSEVIEKAGGFTPFASLSGAIVLYSVEGKSDEIITHRLLRRGLSTAEDTTYLNNEMFLKSRNELTSVDFVGLFEQNEKSKDVFVRDGDKIIIPKKTNVVYVFGEVKKPGYVRFSPGKQYDYYIETAGGETENAESGDIKIIKAGSKQWLDPSNTEIQEGDYIWVPKEPFRTTSYYLTLYTQIFGILASVTSVFYFITITQNQ